MSDYNSETNKDSRASNDFLCQLQQKAENKESLTYLQHLKTRIEIAQHLGQSLPPIKMSFREFEPASKAYDPFLEFEIFQLKTSKEIKEKRIKNYILEVGKRVLERKISERKISEKSIIIKKNSRYRRRHYLSIRNGLECH